MKTSVSRETSRKFGPDRRWPESLSGGFARDILAKPASEQLSVLFMTAKTRISLETSGVTESGRKTRQTLSGDLARDIRIILWLHIVVAPPDEELNTPIARDMCDMAG